MGIWEFDLHNAPTSSGGSQDLIFFFFGEGGAKVQKLAKHSTKQKETTAIGGREILPLFPFSESAIANLIHFSIEQDIILEVENTLFTLCLANFGTFCTFAPPKLSPGSATVSFPSNPFAPHYLVATIPRVRKNIYISTMIGILGYLLILLSTQYSIPSTLHIFFNSVFETRD